MKNTIFWDPDPPKSGIHKGYYDGPLLAIWIWRLCIDLTYTDFAWWLMSKSKGGMW
jgi:hypothetical protein